MYGFDREDARKQFLPTKRIELLEDWYKTVQLYSTCQLKYRDDKLPALAGLARLFQAQLGDEHFAGLWKGDLAHGLSWMRIQEPGHGPNSKFTKDGAGVDAVWSRFPSWSWASCNYPIRRYGSRCVPEPSILDIIEDLDTPGQSSEVPKGRLRARGKIKEALINDFVADTATIYDIRNGYKVSEVRLDNPYFGAPLVPSRLDILSEQRSMVEIECLLLTSLDSSVISSDVTQMILLLELVDDDTHPYIYRRIGAGELVAVEMDDAPDNWITGVYRESEVITV